MLSEEEAVKLIEGIPSDDPEVAHAIADGVLLESAPESVKAAYIRIMNRHVWWATK